VDRAVVALRVRAHTRRARDGEPPVPPGQAAARLQRVNRLFRLDADRPGVNLFEWHGDAPLAIDGAPVELMITAPGGAR
jgi:hypothetical protein